MLTSKIPGSQQTVALQLYGRKKIRLYDFPMIALRTFLSSFNNANHEIAISVLKEGLLRSRNCYHGKVISCFSKLFVGDKDNNIPFYLRTVYSYNIQLSALFICLSLTRLVHFAKTRLFHFTDDYLFKVNAQ